MNKSPTYQIQIERFERLVPIFLALHGAVMLVSLGGGVWPWVLVALVGGLGITGLTRWRLFVNTIFDVPFFRAGVLLLLTWPLLWMTGGTRSPFLLWYVALLSFYPLVLKFPSAVVLSGVVAASFLVLHPLSPEREPVVEIGARAFILLVTGLWINKLGSSIHQYAGGYATLMQQASDGIFIADRRGQLLDVNVSGCAMVGYTFEEILRVKMEDLVAQDDPGWSPIRLDEFSIGQTQRSEQRLMRKDGSVLPVEISVKLLPDGRLQAIAHDISARKQVENERRVAEERYRLISELTSDYAYAMRVEPNGTPRGEWLTEAFTSVFGYTLEDVIARGGLLTLVYPDDLPIVQQHLRRVLGGKADTCEMRFVTKDGEARWLRDHARPVWDEAHERVVRIYGGSQDITDRKQADEKLRDNMALLQIIADNFPRGYLSIINPDLTIGFTTGQAFKSRNLDPQDYVGLPIQDVFSPYGVAVVQTVTDAYLRTFEGQEQAFELLVADEHQSYLTVPLFNEQGVVTRVLAVVQDITERKRVEDEVRRRAEENARLNDQLQRRLAELTVIYRAAQRLQHLLQPDKLAQEIVSVLESSLGHTYGAVLMLDEPTGHLIPFAISDQGHGPAFIEMDRAYITSHGVRLGRGITGWVAQTGQSVRLGDVTHDPRYLALRDDVHSELCVPLRGGDKIIGVVNLESIQPEAYSETDERLLETIAAQMAVAIQNAQLLESVHNQQQHLRALAGYLQSAREVERARIAREIHDELGQILTALKMDLTWLTKHLPAGPASQHDKIAGMSALLDETLTVVRRIATELRPGLLDDLGLIAALRWQARQFRQRSGIPCQLTLPEEEGFTLDGERSLALFRVFQELLTNVARHAGATSVEADLRESADALVLVVRDNGRGITEAQIANSTSLGLIGIRERVGQWDGVVDLHGAPGLGTTVTVRLPLRPLRETDD